MIGATDQIKPPGAWRMALEGRAPWEFGAGLLLSPLLARHISGDGHPVLVVPGLVASDASTALLRRFLQARGWQAEGWEQGMNRGPREGVLERLEARLHALYRRHGRRVSLVGWSLGGVFVRELAKRVPGQVRQVITLGSPVREHRRASNARRVYEWAAGARAYQSQLMARLDDPLPDAVPCTSIYSRTDGIVHWRASLQPAARNRQNIRVPTSHSGMGFHPLVMQLLAERLAQPEDRWLPYRGPLQHG